MKQLKIAQVITRMDWGGSTDIVRIICSSLKADLYNLKLISGPIKYPSQKTQRFMKDFTTQLVIIPQLKRDINILKDFLALVKLYFLFRRERFDIVHTHTAKAGALGRIAARLAGTPFIIHTPHGHNFYGYFGPLMSKFIIAVEKILSSFTDRIVVFTELEKQDFIRFGVARRERIVLIYQGLELGQYSNLHVDKIKIRDSWGIKSDEKVVGMIGRLESVKGPGYFIEAAYRVAKDLSKVKFLMVGEGSLRKNLEERAKSLGLKEKLIFTGWREDIKEIISILDILVLPSLNEAVGMVLIEAQSLNIPVVATKVGGIPEIVKDNVTGILVEAGNSLELSEAIKSLLKDEEKRRQMGNAASQWVKGKFIAEKMVAEISHLYQDLTSRSGLQRCCE